MLKIFAKSAVCAVFLMSCAPSGEPVSGRVGQDPVLTGGQYTSGGGLTVAVSVTESQGRPRVCGVWAQSANQSVLTANVERRVLSLGSVYLGDDRIVQNLQFMREVAPQSSYAGMQAGCTLVARAWQPGDGQKPVTVQIPRQVVANERDEDGGIVVYFEQTGPAAGG